MTKTYVCLTAFLALALVGPGCDGGGNDEGGEGGKDTVSQPGEDTLEPGLDVFEPGVDTIPGVDTVVEPGVDTIPGVDTVPGEDTYVPPEEDPLCPDGLQCTGGFASGYTACLDEGETPAGTKHDCHETGCYGNASCLWADEDAGDSICLENCGECPAGTTCSDVTGDGYLGCLVGGYVPDGATPDCHINGCPGNDTCFYLDAEKTESVCIANCSPCKPGTCGAGMVCVDGACEDEPCTEGSCPEGDICLNGTCVPDTGDGPGAGPGPTCSNLPPLLCEGGEGYCGELIQFDPTNNPDLAGYDEALGYIDYPENGETWANQYRSWLRRDVVMLIQYASAYVACKAGDWSFGNGGPVGLIDMSEENGDIPGTSIDSPGHPDGTHTNGFDLDVAYFQVNTADNRARPVCDHYEGGQEAYHCTAEPHLLDPWRTALFIGALQEHPDLRVIGCDGKVGPMVISAMANLCAGGWLSTFACNNGSLTYEEENQGWGWYYFHHHHIHVSFSGTGYGKPGVPWGEERCIVPGCLDKPLWDFFGRYGLLNKAATPRVKAQGLVPVPLSR